MADSYYSPQLERCPTPKALCSGFFDDNEGVECSPASRWAASIELHLHDAPSNNLDMKKESTDHQQDPINFDKFDDLDGKHIQERPTFIDEDGTGLPQMSQMPAFKTRPAKRKLRAECQASPSPKKARGVNLMITRVYWTQNGETREYSWKREGACWMNDATCDKSLRCLEGEFLLFNAADLVIEVRPNSGLFPVQCKWNESKRVFEGCHELHGHKGFEIGVTEMDGMLRTRKGTGRKAKGSI